MENSIIIAETERLILRRYKKEDLQDLYEYLSDKKVVEFEPYKPMSIEETKENLAWRIATDEMIAVELKSSHKMIGNVYLGKREFEALEIGYVFNKNYWGNGYATESCKALIQQAFSNGTHRIYAECDPNNIRSWKLLEALGFCREAQFLQNVYFWKDENEKPVWKDTYIYAKLGNAQNVDKTSVKENKIVVKEHYKTAIAISILFLVLWYAGAWFNFFPFVGESAAIGFTGLLIVIAIAFCTCWIINTIQSNRK